MSKCELTNDYHKLFFESYEVVTEGGIAFLESEYWLLSFVHIAYSYVLMLSGIIFLGVSLAKDFRGYGNQAYGLIIGVLAPLLGNAYYLWGFVPPGIPDPTPILFTISGMAFAWAIFGGRMLEVVPLAHSAIVQKLSTGIVIFDSDKTIRTYARRI